MMKYLLGILCTFFAISGINAQVIYVKPGASGNGTSWSNAAGNLKQQIDNATSGTQVWVAQGTYYPTTCSSCSSNDRNLSFEIPSGVKVYGGFAGNETNLNQRNLNSNITILSGDINQDNNHFNNSYSIVYFKNVNNNTRLDGFVLKHGNADNTAADLHARTASGGAIYNDGSLMGFSSNPEIVNCTFEENQSSGFGGAVYNYGGFSGDNNSKFRNCIFRNNNTVSAGGAMYNNGSFSGNSSPEVIDCIFENNTSQFNGGAIFNQGNSDGQSNGNFINCTFTENNATLNGGAVVSNGNNGHSSPTFQDCEFNNNSARQGGACYNDGSFSGESFTFFKNCNFNSNTSSFGGGAVYSLGSESGNASPTLENCNFLSNNAVKSGGGVFSNGLGGISNPILTNCVFTSNETAEYGGAIYNLGKSGDASPKITNCMFINNHGTAAGAIYNLGSNNGHSDPVITNCTFYGNTASVGACVYNQANDYSGNVSPVVTNCIAWNNVATSGFGTFFQNGHGTPTISHSLINVDNCDDLNTGINGTTNCGPGLIFNENPMFANAAAMNFHLQEESPAIDNGNNAAITSTGVLFDLDSLIRISNGLVDLGAFEFNTSSYVPPAIVSHPANQSGCEGTTVEFEVSASGSQPMSFQWQKNGVNISGATDSVYTIPSISIGNEGNYVCRITGLFGDLVISNAASLEVFPSQTLSISVQASETEICMGESILFTAVGLNGGPSSDYQWKKNGQNIGTNSTTLNLSNLNDADVITCALSSSGNCVLNSPIESNSIEVTVNNLLTPDIEITSNDLEICQGAQAVFTANTTNGGSNPQFEWFINSESVGNSGNEFSTSSLSNNDIISCQLTSSAICLTSSNSTSNELQVEVNEILTTNITIDASSIEICEGQQVTIMATIENGGDNPEFQWKLNNQLLTENSNSIVFTDLENEDQLTCNLISSESCVTSDNVASNAIDFLVNTNLEVSAILSASAMEVCAGETIDFSVDIENGGSEPLYEWLVNGNDLDLNTPEFSPNNLNDGDVITCQVISNETCTIENSIFTNSVEVQVNPILTLSADIYTVDTSVCNNEEVTFTIDVENEGSNPSYTWQVNGEDRSTGESFSYSDFDTADEVQCIVTSSENCLLENTITSNIISLTVSDNLEVTVDLNTLQEDICENGNAIFIANPSNGGVNPSYEWILNNTPLSETSDSLNFTDLAEGDSIQVFLTSSISCASNSVAVSDIYEVIYSPSLVPSISISSPDTPFCDNQLVLFQADVLNEGLEPTYEWFLNGAVLTENGRQISIEIVQGDEIYSILTSSETCLLQEKDTSNIFIINTDNCIVSTSNPAEKLGVSVFPNPAIDFVDVLLKQKRDINRVELFDAIGKKIKSFDTNLSHNLTTRLDLHDLNPGYYILVLRNNEINFSQKIVISRK